MKKECVECGLVFYKKQNCSLKDWIFRTKLCSIKCAYKHRKGVDRSLTRKRIHKICIMCNQPFQVQLYRKDTAKVCSVFCRKELVKSLEYRENLSNKHKEIVASGRHNLYRGKSTEVQLIRQSSKYKIWREAVYKRDNWTCQDCGQRGGRLNADHIKPFCIFIDLRFDVSNGKTLCENCHQKTPTFARKATNYQLQKI